MECQEVSKIEKNVVNNIKGKYAFYARQTKYIYFCDF